MAEKRSASRSQPRHASEEDSIKAFCPSILLSYLQESYSSLPPKSAVIMRPTSLSFEGTCMIADISGFTKLSSTFSSKGSEGLDQLHQHTNGFLGVLVDMVYNHNGDGKYF